jgi:ribosomal protein L11 methyltransferase
VDHAVRWSGFACSHNHASFRLAMSAAIPWASVEVRLRRAEVTHENSNAPGGEPSAEVLESLAYELALHPDIGGVEVRDETTGFVSPMSVAPGTEETAAQAESDQFLFGGWLGNDTGLIVFTTPTGLENAHSVIDELAQSYGLRAQIHAQIHTDDRWRDAWKEFYRPMLLGEGTLRIRPSWHAPPAADQPQAAIPELVLDPGRAFGTGLHETTRLCLDALASAQKAGRSFHSCLDLGCGSGILGLAALRLFPNSLHSCDLIDNDPEAVAATEENLVHNSIPDTVARARLGTDASIEGPQYDLVLANIRPSVLIPAAPMIAKTVRENGQLILSGILDEEADQVIAAYLDLGLTLVNEPSEGGWTALIWQRIP